MKLIRYIEGEEDFRVETNSNIVITTILNTYLQKYDQKPTINVYTFGFEIRYEQTIYRVFL